MIEGNERTVFRRIATFFYMREGGSVRIRQVDPDELQAALDRDQGGPDKSEEPPAAGTSPAATLLSSEER